MPKYELGMNWLWPTEWLLMDAVPENVDIVSIIKEYFPNEQFNDARNKWVVNSTNEVVYEGDSIDMFNYAQWHFVLYQPRVQLRFKLYEPRQWLHMVSEPAGRTSLERVTYNIGDGEALLLPAWLYHSIDNYDSCTQHLKTTTARFQIGHNDWTGIVPG